MRPAKDKGPQMMNLGPFGEIKVLGPLLANPHDASALSGKAWLCLEAGTQPTCFWASCGGRGSVGLWPLTPWLGLGLWLVRNRGGLGRRREGGLWTERTQAGREEGVSSSKTHPGTTEEIGLHGQGDRSLNSCMD